ncbi:glycosyltransferase family 4 protein [Nonlabens xiamenensis]|uniref:glycosyltransferase family 4 protein n=1 Tax=Nonlabens xiamenensis TaxID=2341043 RepID=UPI000F60E5EA|nr:glycosyltransferase family 4 protein [Nonlabens xiamenensis]
MKKLLITGPFPLPITGVSLGTQIVYDEFKKKDNYQVQMVNTSYSRFDEKIGKLSLHKAWFYLKLQIFFYKVFRNDIIYITIGQTFYGVLKYALYILSASVANKQIVIHIHGNYLGKQYSELTGIKKRLFHFIMSRTNQGIVSSDSLKDNFRPFIPEDQIFSLKNFTLDELFVSDEVVHAKKYDRLHITYLSNLMLEKGIFELLEALLSLEEENVPYQARIAGNIAPENSDRVMQLLERLEHTEYLGTVDVKEKTDLLTWSNIFILPTFYTMEAQPFAILEAMATGNMIITTPHAGIPDIFRDQINGVYVEKQNADSITSQLKKVAAQPSMIRNYGLHNVKEAREKYRIPQFADNLEAIFNAAHS